MTDKRKKYTDKQAEKGLVRRSFWLPASKYQFVKNFISNLNCADHIAEIELTEKIKSGEVE